MKTTAQSSDEGDHERNGNPTRVDPTRVDPTPDDRSAGHGGEFENLDEFENFDDSGKDRDREAPAAWIIGIGLRRYVVVRKEETNRLRPVARKRIDDLRIGDKVLYEGIERYVLALQPY